MILRFELHREQDTTGVSGIGKVAEGVRFSSGTCVIQWRLPIQTVTIYSSMAEVRQVHCHDKTRVEWVDDCFWGQRDLCDSREAMDKSLPMLRADPFNRGKFDCMMDGNENVPFASIGGLGKRESEPWAAPDYVPEADRKAYLEGYKDQAWAQYGSGWRTCPFGWAPVMTIDKDGVHAADPADSRAEDSQ